MLQKIKKILSKYPLLEVGSFNSISVFVKLISSFVVSKLSALLLGTQGIALIGNLNNTLSICQSISTLGLNNAIVKYTGETKNKNSEFKVFVSTLFVVFLGLSILVFCIIFFNSRHLSFFVFKTEAYSFVFKTMSILLPLYGLNAYLLSILKGYEKFRKVIQINIYIHILNLIVFSICIWIYGLEGALIAIVIVPSISFFITLLLASQYFQFWSHIQLNTFSKKYLNYFGQYSVMTLISAISFPMVYLGIRLFLEKTISTDAAGYWEMNFRISTFYLVFIQSLMQLYILPKLVSAQSSFEFRTIILEFYKQIVPFFVAGLLIIFLLKDYIVLIISSKEFLPTSSLIGWQLVADFFRVLALVMVYQFHAKKMFWHYVITDLILALALYTSALFFIPNFGLKGVVIAHAIVYMFYFMLILGIFRKVFITKYLL